MSAVWRRPIAFVFSLFIVPFVLISCGGEGSVQMEPHPAPMVDHESVSFLRGVVTAANPDSDVIQVGEDEVVITGAALSRNGASDDSARPSIGQTVNLTVNRDRARGRFVAQAIDVALVAKGPIENVNRAGANFTVLGQTVSYSSTTVFANFPAGATLDANMMVSISGSVVGNGQITATRVEYLGANYSAASGIQASGIIQNLNTSARTFTMGNLTVNYSLAPATTVALANGQLVSVGAITLPQNRTLNVNELTTSGGGGVTQPIGSVIDTTIALRGPIEQVNLTASTFTVMGQTVSYNTATQFPSTINNTLAIGYVVRVTAAPSTVSGQFTATRVELVSTTYTPGTAVQASGIVQNVNTNLRTFNLGALTVNYASVTTGVFTPTNGMSVIVGALSAPVANTLTATEMRQGSGTGTTPGTPIGGTIEFGVAIKGPIEQVNTAASTFTVMGQTVNYTTATQFVGTTANTLLTGNVVRVTATQTFSGGPFTATRVELVGTTYTPGTAVQVSGAVQNINTTSRTFTLGTLTVNYASVTSLTFTPTTGMNVIVGALSAPLGNTLTATEMQQGSGTGTPIGGTIEFGVAIKGPIEQVNTAASTFTVMGQTVNYTTATQFVGTTANTLFTGNVVRVTATQTFSGGPFSATRVELVSTTYTPGAAVQVSGAVQNINTTSRTFTLGTLSVNYASVTSLTFTPTTGMNVVVGALSAPVGNTLTATDLQQGSGTGTPGTPIGGTIEFGIAVKGPIEQVNTAASTFTVMGQTVSYTTATQFVGTTSTSLRTGNVVRVTAAQSGLAGQFSATRVELVSNSYVSGTAVQASGTVQNLNTTSRTFTLGNLTVNYAGVTSLTFTPTTGMSVIVGSTLAPSLNTLTATEMQQGSGTGTGPITGTIEPGIAIKGPIEQVNALGSTFTVMGQTVSYTTATQFVGTTSNALFVGNVVRVTGTSTGFGGQLTATRVELVSNSYVTGTSVQVSGTIQNLNTTSRTFSLGTLSVNYASVTSLTFTPANGVSVTAGGLSAPIGNLFTATEMLPSTTGTTPGCPGGVGCPGNPGTPGSIDFTASLIGPVDNVNAAGSFTMLGQTVTFTTATQFVTSTGQTFVLTPGNVVKVISTPSTIPGQYVATRVELVSTSYFVGSPVQVSGTIQSVNTTARTFVMGTLTVNYSTVNNLTFTPTVGMSVIAASTSLPVGNVFTATAMTATSSTLPPGTGTIPGLPTQPTVAVVSGTIVSVLSTAEFSLTGVTVRINAATQFVNGSQALLLPGMSVMVTGTLSGGLPNAYLDASIIRFSGSPVAGASRVMIRGPIEFVDLINRRISVLGINVSVPLSSISIRDDDADRSMDLANLRPGMVVTVAGMGTNRQLTATFVALARGGFRTSSATEEDSFESRLPSIGVSLNEDSSTALSDEAVLAGGTRAWLWAPLDFIQPPLISAFGVPVTTTDTTRFYPAGHDTRASSPTAFFGAATTGNTVRVEGVYANGTFVATRVCIVDTIRGADLNRNLDDDD